MPNKNIYSLKDLEIQTLTFFTAKELKKNCVISKNWKKNTEELLQRTDTQIFYTVGSPIFVAKVKTSGLASTTPRTSIAPRELIKAFPKEQARLFENEKTALAYARSQQSTYQTQDDRLYHPAVYTVQFLGTLPSKTKELIKFQSFLENKICEKELEFFEVNSQLLLPYLAQIKINFHEDFAIGQDPFGHQFYKEYPVYQFNLPLPEPKISCLIL